MCTCENCTYFQDGKNPDPFPFYIIKTSNITYKRVHVISYMYIHI